MPTNRNFSQTGAKHRSSKKKYRSIKYWKKWANKPSRSHHPIAIAIRNGKASGTLLTLLSLYGLSKTRKFFQKKHEHHEKAKHEKHNDVKVTSEQDDAKVTSDYAKAPSKHFCQTGKLEDDEQFNADIHKEQCSDRKQICMDEHSVFDRKVHRNKELEHRCTLGNVGFAENSGLQFIDYTDTPGNKGYVNKVPLKSEYSRGRLSDSFDKKFEFDTTYPIPTKVQSK